MDECRISTVAQARIHAEGHIGGRHHRVEQNTERVREALSAISRIGDQRRPAAVHECLISFLETGGCCHHTVFKFAAHLIANHVERLQDFFRQLCRFFKDLIDQIHRRIGKAFQLCVLGQVERVVQQETVFL